MSKRLALVALVVLAAMVILPTVVAVAQVVIKVGDGENPVVLQPQQGNPGAGGWTLKTRGVVVPPVPVPPGVLGANAPLPCVVPSGERERERGEAGGVWTIKGTDRD